MPVVPLQFTASRATFIENTARDLGFARVGIAPAQPSEHADAYHQWLAEGKHGDMHYLANHIDQRLDPRAFLENARSVICVADRYPEDCVHAQSAESADVQPTAAAGRVARYAWGDDYHKVMKSRLFELADALRAKWPEHDYRVAVDTAPVLEREHAVRAGLGWVGKHTLLINPAAELGSWFLLGEIVTTLPLQTAADIGAVQTDHCGTCTRCIEACPTDCITPYSVDASRCISYLTLEHRGPIDRDLFEPMGDWIAGCDVCQEVCPWNSGEGRGPRAEGREAGAGGEFHERYAPRELAGGLSLLEILNWTAEDRQRVFRGSALKRIKLDMIRRNALIAAGNALARRPDEALLSRIRDIAHDQDEPALVRTTARQVLSRLEVNSSASEAQVPSSPPSSGRAGEPPQKH